MDIKSYEYEIEQLKKIKSELKNEIIELDDKILFQGFGVYTPQYNFASVDEYKDRLNSIRNKQNNMIKMRNAAVCNTAWKVQGSSDAGKKMIAENIKQTLRNFNIECDLIISKVKFSNYTNSKERITKSFELQNKLNETKDIHITREYLDLKIEELNLAYEYTIKKEEEKEENRRIREELREAEKVAKEIEERRKEYEKEQIHYENAMKRLQEQLSVEKNDERINLLLNRQEELSINLKDVDKAIKDLDYRVANYKAGFVYIISNIGAFGENVYKIGMTRRLDPLERISELSGASVPFKYDVHAMIFTDDAPKLESALHNAFADKKLNLVNSRKEFFKVKLEQIKKVVQDNYDKTVDFVDLPEAEHYRTSEMIRRNVNNLN